MVTMLFTGSDDCGERKKIVGVPYEKDLRKLIEEEMGR